MVIVYYLLFQKFHRDYLKSKTAGFRNNYFLGFSLLFFILLVFNLFYGLYELYINAIPDPVSLKNQFDWYADSENTVGSIINNQMRPAHLIFYFMMNMVMAAQIYPLEQANGWKKNPVMKFIILCGFSVWLVFIKPIGLSSFAVVPVILGFTGIGIGFLLNIGINLKLYMKAAGAIRTRALYAFSAFLTLAIGILFSMELGWGEFIHRTFRIDGKSFSVRASKFWVLIFTQKVSGTFLLQAMTFKTLKKKMHFSKI